MKRLHALRARLGDLRLCQAERVADAWPGVAADQDGTALIAGIERPHRDLGALLEVADRRLRIRDMPSKMPDRALRLRRRRPVDLVEQDQHVIGRVEGRIAAPFSFARAWELPGIEVDRRLRIDRVEVQMMKAGGAEHRDGSSLEILSPLCARPRRNQRRAGARPSLLLHAEAGQALGFRGFIF